MTSRFFCESIPESGATAMLDRDESHHAAKVLRLESGEAVDLVDGRGGWARGEVERVDAKGTAVRVTERQQTEPYHQVTVAFGITKGAALDFIVHRLTEVGVREMVPLLTDHSLAPKEWNEERWTRVLRETAKQCQETWFPTLRSPVRLSDFLAELGSRPFAVCDEADRAAGANLPRFETVLVGPEGGWSAPERALFRRQGAHFLGLGRNRLRAETAALASTLLVKKHLGEV